MHSCFLSVNSIYLYKQIPVFFGVAKTQKFKTKSEGMSQQAIQIKQQEVYFLNKPRSAMSFLSVRCRKTDVNNNSTKKSTIFYAAAKK